MSDFKFTCPNCNQHIAGDEALRGQKIQCPGCDHSITVPRPFSDDPPAVEAEVQETAVETFGAVSPKTFFEVVRSLALSALIWVVAVTAAVVICWQFAKHKGEETARAKAAEERAAREAALKPLSPELQQADKIVRDHVFEVYTAVGNYRKAVKDRDDIHRSLRGATPNADMATKIIAADTAIDTASTTMSAAYKGLDAAIAEYKKLGGTVDYRRQVP